ncbi:MAG: glycosyltransferase [Bacteroidota bacterium]|nr:glycosyltransferase [Bacteroidota bacterium]
MPEKKRISYEVSIIIPVYNGSDLLERHMSPFLTYLDGLPYKTEVVIVDDGSLDRDLTSAYAQRHDLAFFGLDANLGKGAALRKGFELARGNFLLFTDADIPFQYQNIEALIYLLRENPNRLVIGDRTDPLSAYFEKTTLLRNAGSRILSLWVNLFFISSIQDTQCGLKGMGKAVSKKLFGDSCINRFAIDIELIYLAFKNNIPVLKMPVQLRCNDKSSVNTIKDGLKLLQDLRRIRKIHGKRKFK